LDSDVAHPLSRPLQQVGRELRALHEVEVHVLAVVCDGSHPDAVERVIGDAPFDRLGDAGQGFLDYGPELLELPPELRVHLRKVFVDVRHPVSTPSVQYFRFPGFRIVPQSVSIRATLETRMVRKRSKAAAGRAIAIGVQAPSWIRP